MIVWSRTWSTIVTMFFYSYSRLCLPLFTWETRSSQLGCLKGTENGPSSEKVTEPVFPPTVSMIPPLGRKLGSRRLFFRYHVLGNGNLVAMM